MLDGVFDLFANVLALLYSWVHSYGFAITALTLVVMAVTTPLTYKGTKSMLQMQRLQPQLKAIQARHKGDREKMNEELLKFYKANNINPVGGCLPLIIQMPVFFILFQVLRGLTRRVTNVGLQAGLAATGVVSGQGFVKADDPLNDFRPKYISTDSQLYSDLSGTNRMKSWGIDMAESASKALTNSIGHAIPYLLLIVAVLVTGVVQQRQIAGRNTSAQINPQQQMIMKLMPIFLPVFSFAMPAGLVVYFIVSNLWRIGQQAFITRKFYTGEHALGNLAAAARGTVVEEEEPEVIETKVKSTTKNAGGEDTKPVVGRNRSTMARSSNRVGGRLRELDTKPAERKKPVAGRQKPEKKGASEPAASPKFTSRRVTPKSGDGKGKRK